MQTLLYSYTSDGNAQEDLLSALLLQIAKKEETARGPYSLKMVPKTTNATSDLNIRMQKAPDKKGINPHAYEKREKYINTYTNRILLSATPGRDDNFF